MLYHPLRTLTLSNTLLLTLGLGLVACGAPDTTSSPTQSTSPTENGSQDPGQLEVSTDLLEFGSVPEGGSKTLTIVVTNIGGQKVDLDTVDASGSNSSWFTVGYLDDVEPNSSINIEVSFKPTNADDAQGTLTFNASPGEQSFSLTVSGEGTCKDNDNDGYCGTEGDCDDTEASSYPGADEYCDNLDNDCDGEVDNDPVDGETYYTDGDQDDYGAQIPNIQACEKPPGRTWVEAAGDCNDANDTVHPGAEEICDGLDNNCDGEDDEGNDSNGDGLPDCQDNDLDGYCYGPDFCVADASTGDCLDTSAEANPGLDEQPGDGIDNNCNGEIDENRPPTVEFASPTDGLLIGRDELTSIFLQADDLEDSSGGMDVVVTSSLQGELCSGVTTGTNTFTCDVTLDYGKHELNATVTDSKDDTATDIISVSVDQAPVIETIIRPTEGQELVFGQDYTFFATVNDPDPEQKASDLTFSWSSSVGGIFFEGDIQADGLAEADVGLVTEGEQVLTLTVYDDQGVSTSQDVNVLVTESPCSNKRNLVVLYHMDEGGGSEIIDSSGNGLHGSPSAVVWTPGKFGEGLAFDGAQSAVVVPNSGGMLSLQTFTIEAWVHFAAPGPVPLPISSQPLIYKSTAEEVPSENYDLRVGTGTTPQTNGSAFSRIEETGSGQEVAANGSKAVERNVWHLLSATYDGNTLKTFLDGEMVAYQDESITLATGNGPLYLGTDRFGGTTAARTLDGDIDEVRILDCPLTERQILDDFESGEPNTDPELPEETPTQTPTATATWTSSPSPTDGDATPTGAGSPTATIDADTSLETPTNTATEDENTATLLP